LTDFLRFWDFWGDNVFCGKGLLPSSHSMFFISQGSSFFTTLTSSPILLIRKLKYLKIVLRAEIFYALRPKILTD
jgi:hypothetical protein